MQNQIAVGRALVVQRIVRHRREGRLQAGKPLQRGLRPRIFLAIQREAAVFAMDRHETLVEIAGADGVGGLLLALKPQRVDVPPGDAFEGRDGVGANALMRLRMPGAETKIAGVHHHGAVAAASLHRHHLGATGDHEILGARHDSGGCHVDAGDAGSAEAVERDAAGTEIISGVERGHPAEIAALLAALGAGAPDDVVDIGGIDPGAIGQRPQHGRA